MTKPRKRAKRAESRPASSQMAASTGRAIQVVRTDRGWSRKELAARTGLSYSYLSEIENGVKEPSSRTFALIAQALDVAPGALLYDAERRLAETDGELADLRPGSRGSEVETAAESADPLQRTRPAELFKPQMHSSASERPAPSTPRGERGPRIERSPRVLDWLAGPLARRSADDSAAAARPRAGAADRDDPELLRALEAPPREFESAGSSDAAGSDERLPYDLLALLGELSPEDRERVLDLARRLAQRNSES